MTSREDLSQQEIRARKGKSDKDTPAKATLDLIEALGALEQTEEPALVDHHFIYCGEWRFVCNRYAMSLMDADRKLQVRPYTALAFFQGLPYGVFHIPADGNNLQLQFFQASRKEFWREAARYAVSCLRRRSGVWNEQ